MALRPVFSLRAMFMAHVQKIARIHSFRLRRPCGVRGKSQKRGFGFFKKSYLILERAEVIRFACAASVAREAEEKIRF